MTPTKADYKHAVKCLTKAQSLIADPDNWGQGYMELENRHCAVGALRVACLGIPYPSSRQRERSRPYNLAIEALRTSNVLPRSGLQDFTTNESAVIGWNDGFHRSHTEVLAGFDKAIAALKAES